MNKRDKLNLIRNAMRQSTPDITEHIDLNQIQHLGPTIDPNLFLATKTFPFKVSYQRLAFLFTMVIVLVTGIVFVGDQLANRADGPANELYEQRLASHEEEPFAFAMLSGSTIMQHFITEINAQQTGFQSYNPNVWLIEERLGKLNRYLQFINGLLEDQTKNSIEVIQSTNEDYQYQMSYQINQLDQSSLTQTIYFNVKTILGTKQMDGLIESNQDTLYFEVRFESVDTIVYQFFTSPSEKTVYIELTQVIQPNQTSFQFTKYSPYHSTTDAMMIMKSDGVELLFITNNKIDAVFQVSKEDRLVITYQIGTQTVGALVEGLFPSAADYQFEQRSLYEVGTIVISFQLDPFSGVDRVNYSITRPNFGTRVYLYDID